MLAEDFGFESIFGAFAAGLVVGLATRGPAARRYARNRCRDVRLVRPFFFVGTGVKFDFDALAQNLTTMLLVPAFLLLFLR